MAGTLRVSTLPALAWPPQERENRLLGLGMTASQLPRPPAAPTPCPPGGLVATAAPGSWGFGCSAGVSPSRSTARGLAAPGAYLDSFGQPSSFPACPARRSRRGVPRPDFAIGRGPAAGAPRNASCRRSLRWVNLAALELRERGPRASRPARSFGRGTLGRASRVRGIGAPAQSLSWGRGAPVWPPLCWSRGASAGSVSALTSWGKLELRTRDPCAARAGAVGCPSLSPGC